VSAIDDNEERTRLERENVLRRDYRLAKAGQEVRATAMKRKGKDRRAPHEENGENEDDDVWPPSREGDDAVAPSRTMRGKKRHKHQLFGLEELIATNQERKEKQEILKLKTDRLEFEKERAAAHKRNEERRLQISSSQADLQRQQQNDNSRMQLNMLQVVDIRERE
jgi:hypothetical protein